MTRIRNTASDREDDKVLISIQSQDGAKIVFGIKRNLPLKKLLMKYCRRKQLYYPTMNFLYKRRRVPVRSTPNELHMKNGDQIDAMVHVHSG